MTKKKVLLSWSSGKDSAWALHRLRQDPAIEVVGLFTTLNQAFERVAMHGVRKQLLMDQVACVGLPLHCIDLPWPCSNEEYGRIMTGFIAEVLAMNFEEATAFFRAVPQVSEKLRTVCLVGLGYLRLGQGANALSGGEAQRLKLAAELGKRSTGRTLYLLDEPTSGLHFQDIEVLLSVLFRLRDAGNTLIVIEHNLDVVRSADWVVDLGPDGGEAGGRILVEGPPETVAACEQSETGRFLRRYFDRVRAQPGD